VNALLVMAHGSPRTQANQDIVRAADSIRDSGRYPIVVVGFLDCNDPDIPAAIDECVAAGATKIVAVPYFLHSGRHFLIDIPEILGGGALRHPEVEILMGDYLGRMPQIADILRDRIDAVR
jgi:sirohydrochlorin ferrochelatase